jgi:hypothetical protein
MRATIPNYRFNALSAERRSPDDGYEPHRPQNCRILILSKAQRRVRGKAAPSHSGGRARIKHVAKGMAYEPGIGTQRRDFRKGEELYTGGGPDLQPDKTGGTGERGWARIAVTAQ